jgi:hypothetical protein
MPCAHPATLSWREEKHIIVNVLEAVCISIKNIVTLTKM